MSAKPSMENRYLEKDGRIYRWDGNNLYPMSASGSDRLLEIVDAKPILLSGVEVSEGRAIKVIELVEGHQDYVEDDHVKAEATRS